MSITLVFLTVVLLLISVSLAFADATPAHATAPARTLEVTVVAEESGAPIAGATVKWHDGKEKIGTADATGKFVVSLPEKIGNWFRVIAASPQRPRVSQSWSMASNAPNAEAPVPSACTIKLPRGVTIGGLVNDDAGKPIAGAKLNLRHFMVSGHAGPSLGEQTVTTDAQGRWTYDAAPAEFGGAGASIFDATLEHPDFMRKDRFSIGPGDVPRMRDGTFTLTMTKGLALTGQVTDEQGKPIQGAEILRGQWELAAKAETDADGKFTMNQCPPGQACIVVKAAGRAPQKFNLDIKRDMAPLHVALSPGKVLRVKVADNEGKPIEGASVAGRQWDSTMLVHFQRTTNAEGLAEWNEAPDGAVEVQVWKADHAQGVRGDRMAPHADPHVVTLYRLAAITGTVIDAATRQPVPAFTAVPIIDWRSDGEAFFSTRATAVPGAAGRYEFKMDRSDLSYHVRIEAPGYRTAMSPTRVHISKGNATCDFALEPAAPVTGRVVDAQGLPVEGATVYAVTCTQPLQDNSGFHKIQFEGTASVKSDAQGRFTLPSQVERYTLVAVHDRGVGRLDGDAESASAVGDLRIKAWARIEGQLLARGRAVGGQYVYLNPIGHLHGKGQPSLFVHQAAATDQEGRFVFERVPPEKVCLRADVSPWQASALTSGEMLPLDVKPNAILKVTLNGPGRVLTGKAAPRGEAAAGLDMKFSLNYLVRHDGAIDPPPVLSDPRWKKIVGWDDSFALTPEGRAAHMCRQGAFVKLNADGTFRAEGLAEGKYDLRIQLYDDPKGGCLTTPVGTRTVTIDIAGPVGSERDIGTIEVEVGKIPKAGDAAPDFAYTDEQGRPRKLSAWRGKYVVLDFWATWCGPCAAEMPAVKKLHDEMSSRGVMVLGMSLDADGAAVWRAVKSRGMSWPQGWAGDMNQSSAAKAYAIAAVPTLILIAPDGKILAREHGVGAIRNSLDKALKGTP